MKLTFSKCVIHDDKYNIFWDNGWNDYNKAVAYGLSRTNAELIVNNFNSSQEMKTPAQKKEINSTEKFLEEIENFDQVLKGVEK